MSPTGDISKRGRVGPPGPTHGGLFLIPNGRAGTVPPYQLPTIASISQPASGAAGNPGSSLSLGRVGPPGPTHGGLFPIPNGRAGTVPPYQLPTLASISQPASGAAGNPGSSLSLGRVGPPGPTHGGLFPIPNG